MTTQYLWISEKFFLQGMCSFLAFMAANAQRSLLQLDNKTCVYNDILQLDFTKFKQALDEHNDKIKYNQTLFEEEHKGDNEKFVLKIEDRVKKMALFLRVMARGAEYARNARAWL